MRYRDGRRSVCVSSQSGCPLTCTFCATGSMRFGRNLTASEILDQVLHFRRIEPVDHLVFMGMGEPLMNVDAVLEAAARLPDVGITHRRTGGLHRRLGPGHRRLTEERDCRCGSRSPCTRLTTRCARSIMPVNDRYPIADVLAACEAYYARRRRRVFVEYVMLAGVNDRYAQAVALAQLLDPRIYKVNLIPYNPTGAVRRLLARRDRRLPGGARGARPARDRPPDARPRHRRRVRAARRAVRLPLPRAPPRSGRSLAVPGRPAGDRDGRRPGGARARPAPSVVTVPAVEARRPEIGRIIELDRRLAAAVREAVAAGDVPLVLAGACMSALGTVAGIGADGLGVVWLDAHADMDTPEDNRSGFFDVMALSVLTGTGWTALRETIPGFAPVPEEHVVLAGARDLEPYQRARIGRSGVHAALGAFRAEELDAALGALRGRVERVYLHVDLDVLDSRAGARTSTPRRAAPGRPRSWRRSTPSSMPSRSPRPR